MTINPYYGNNSNFAKAFGGQIQFSPSEIAQDKARLEAFPYINDSVVSVIAGAAKLPSDLGALFNAGWANDWEDTVNVYRNQNQSNKLNSERLLATKAINAGMPLTEVVQKFPYASTQYALETGAVPLGSTIKAGKTAKNVYSVMKTEKSFNRAKKANNAKIIVPSSIAYIGSTPTQAYGYNLYRDYKENRGDNG